MDMIQLLEASGANLHIGDDKAFCSAASSGNVDLAVYLLDRGADFKAHNGEPLRLADQRGLPERSTL